MVDILNSSTSNSELRAQHRWQGFVKTLVICLLVLAGTSYSFILLVDPYSSVPFSPKLERVEVGRDQQRYFYPALARNPRFDSAFIGNSNIRLLRPDIFNESLGGEWVNLAMNAASSWEQEQIYNVFIRHHDSVKNLFIGMDYLWCQDKQAQQKFAGQRLEAHFPAWLYDEDTRNDLPPLTLGSLEHAWLQFLTAFGLREKHYGDDGYTVFTDPPENYRLNKARRNIYGTDTPKPIVSVKPPVRMNGKERRSIPISALARLKSMLAKLSNDTRVILFFVPYHSYYQAAPGSRQAIIWEECKRRVAGIARKRQNTVVLDFMIRSDITREDRNYWDHKHYTVDIGNRISAMIAPAVLEGAESEAYRILHPAPSTQKE